MRFVIPVVIVFAVALFAVMAGQNNATNPSSTTTTAMVQMDGNGVITPAEIEPAAGDEESINVNPQSAEMLQKAIAKMAPESTQPIILQQSPSAE